MYYHDTSYETTIRNFKSLADLKAYIDDNVTTPDEIEQLRSAAHALESHGGVHDTDADMDRYGEFESYLSGLLK